MALCLGRPDGLAPSEEAGREEPLSPPPFPGAHTPCARRFFATWFPPTALWPHPYRPTQKFAGTGDRTSGGWASSAGPNGVAGAHGGDEEGNGTKAGRAVTGFCGSACGAGTTIGCTDKDDIGALLRAEPIQTGGPVLLIMISSAGNGGNVMSLGVPRPRSISRQRAWSASPYPPG